MAGALAAVQAEPAIAGEAVSDPAEREAQVRKLILSQATTTAVLGAFPVPGFSIAFDILIVVLQGLMVLNIARIYGFDPNEPKTREVRALIVGNLGLVGATIAVRNLAKFIPGAGSVFGGAATFATTYAAGEVAKKYFAGGGTLDAASVREELKLARKAGEAAYQQNAEAIAARKQALEPQMQSLAADLKAGRLTEAEYQQKVQELTRST